MTGNRIRITSESTRQCTGCGAVGTHYLTCPSLRLPPGYRVIEDPGPTNGSSAGRAVRHARPDGPRSNRNAALAADRHGMVWLQPR